MYKFFFKKVHNLFSWEHFSLSAALMYRLCAFLSKKNTCPATEGVKGWERLEKYNRKGYLYWRFSGIAEMKGSDVIGRGWSAPSDMGSATSLWKLLCLVWEASLKTGSELQFPLPGQHFNCRKGSLTWLSSFSSQVCLFLLSSCFHCT